MVSRNTLILAAMGLVAFMAYEDAKTRRKRIASERAKSDY